MVKPEEKKLLIRCYNGDDICAYVDSKLGLPDGATLNFLYRYFPSDLFEYSLFNMIIEEEEYGNDDGQKYEILRTIAEDFGGDILVDFIPYSARLFNVEEAD